MKTSRGLTTANFSIVAAMFILGLEAKLPAQTTSQGTAQIGKLQLVKTPPETGTFWSLQRPDYAPLPFVPEILGDVDVYYMGEGNTYVYNDVEFDYEAYQAKQAELVFESGVMLSMEEESGGGESALYSDISTDDLWIEILAMTNNYAYLTLHGTVLYESYQLLSTNDVSGQPNEWVLGDIITDLGGTNQTDFPPALVDTNAMMFFRAHHANPVVYLYRGQDAYETNAAVNDPGQIGTFYLSGGNLSSDLTVYYRLSGSAQNNADYTNLSGQITIPAATGSARIDIQSLPDTLIEGIETITVTLVQTNAYLIPAGYDSATITLNDSSTTVRLGLASDGIAIEPDGPPGAVAKIASLYLDRSDTRILYPPLTVRYSITGTASNGVDYATLSGTVTFPDQVNYTNMDIISPLADSVFEGAETVTLTLIPTNTYLIEPNGVSETITIRDSSTTVSVSVGAQATETNSASNIPGQTGHFVVSRSDTRGATSNALAVSYSVSGTASNTVDYTNLTGTVSIAAGQTATNIYVQTLEDNAFEGDETVKLTLTANPTNLDAYMMSSNFASATMTIQDNLATNAFVPVVTSLAGPIGIDYHAPSNSLIVSYNYNASGATNFARIYTNQFGSNVVTVITNWSGVAGLGDEVKLATVFTGGALTNAAGFTNGDTFFSSDTGIGWISADGTKSNLNWCILTNAVETNALPVRGGLYVDRSGVFSNRLVVVTSPGSGTNSNKGVWRVNAQGQPVLITHINTPHLEGVVTEPNTNFYGPWAGKIITGDEDTFPVPLIYTIDTNGVVTSYDTTTLFPGGIYPEDFDIIPPNQSLYACDYDRSMIVKLSATYLTNYVGDLLITQAGENLVKAKLFIVHWDASITNFVTHSFSYKRADGSDGRFEHVTFAPIDFPPK